MKITLFAVIITIVSCLNGCLTTQKVVTKTIDTTKDIEVTETPRGLMLTVSERLLFDSGKSIIKPESDEVMVKVADIIINKTDADILVEGHTDSRGSDVTNQKLSLARANAVKEVLILKKVPPHRVQIAGLGATMPKADNSTEDGRRLNRRTEIYLLGENKKEVKEVVNESVFEGALTKLRNLFD
ncbi:MAG: OmpA family protein [Desulfamplus sp.]|nr:OmpA family protein [Desulfamplus sp.]